MKNAVLSWLDVKEEEQKPFNILFLQSFLIGISNSFYFVATYSFLIKNTPISNLPIAYILSGSIGFLILKMFQKSQQVSGIIKSQVLSHSAFALVCVLVFFGSVFFKTDAFILYLAYAGFVFIMPFTAIFAINLSSLCFKVFDIAQSKRLLALIGTGEILASIFTFLLAPLITKNFSQEILLLIGGLFSLIALLPLVKVKKLFHEKLKMKASKAQQMQINLDLFKQQPFFLYIALVTVFSVIAIYVVDYGYLVSLRFFSSLTGIEVALVVSWFFAVAKIAELTFSLLSGRILSSIGMQRSMLILSFLLLVIFTISFLLGLLLYEIPLFLVFFLFLAKLTERVIRKTIDAPSFKVLFQITMPHERLQLQTNMEGLINQASTLFAGLLLWSFSLVLPPNEPLKYLNSLSAIGILLFLAWFLMSNKLYKLYRARISYYLDNIKRKRKMVSSSLVKSKKWAAQLEKNSELFRLNKTSIEKITELTHEIDNAELVDKAKFLSAYSNLIDQSFLGLNKQEQLKKLEKVYFTQNSFLFRFLVIKTIEDLNQKPNTESIINILEASTYPLRLEYLRFLNKTGFKPANDNNFYFINQVTQSATDIAWCEAAINDLEAINEPIIKKELERLLLFLRNILFEYLKLCFDTNAIICIQEIYQNIEDKENMLFSLELLDNKVSEEIKNIVSPLFEPNSFSQKKQKLENFIPIYELNVKERLRDIVMKDFKMINAFLKEKALAKYYELEGNKKLLEAFEFSNIENLEQQSRHLLGKTTNETFSEKQSFIHTFNLEKVFKPDNIYELLETGFFVQNHYFRNAQQNNNVTFSGSSYFYPLFLNPNKQVSVNLLSLALMFKFNEVSDGTIIS